MKRQKPIKRGELGETLGKSRKKGIFGDKIKYSDRVYRIENFLKKGEAGRPHIDLLLENEKWSPGAASAGREYIIKKYEQGFSGNMLRNEIENLFSRKEEFEKIAEFRKNL